MKKVILTYNTSLYLYRFRKELIRAFQDRDIEVVAAAPADEWTSRIQSLGVRFVRLPLSSHGMNPVQEVGCLRFLYELFRDERPDIVLNFTIKPVIYGSIAAHFAGVPSICSMVTGLGYTFIPATFRQRCLRQLVLPQYRFALRFNRVVFFQNPDDKQLFLDLRLIKNEQAIVTGGSGVNLADFRVSEDQPDRSTFLLIARLLREKGIREYAAAAKKLKGRYPQAKFLLLGPFDSGPSAIHSDEISGWLREGVVEYLGTAEDVRPYLKRSEVFVLPSYREGTPRSVLEAMAVGKPIVTFDVPGCRETVEHGKNGFLVPPHDVDALAAAMANFIENPTLATTMGAQSRRIVEERYDVHKVNAEILGAVL